MTILVFHREIKMLTDLPLWLSWTSPRGEGGWQGGHGDLHNIIISVVLIGRESKCLGYSQ